MENFYDQHANELANQYLSKSFEEIHQSWIKRLPTIFKRENLRVMDIGAGAGRDAKYLAQQAKMASTQNTTIEVYNTISTIVFPFLVGQTMTYGIWYLLTVQ